ncbi:hypothetical protein FB451DRAFT_1190741 [Mycena latifolia]|nr:hypothetical protein FB451DRAFT_1190741 [Mycena latifolia]
MAAPAEWALQSTSTSSAPTRRAPPPVCDDWEDDDDDCADADEEEPHAPADNQRIWDDACERTGAHASPNRFRFRHGAAARGLPARDAHLQAPDCARARGPALPVRPGETLRDREAHYQEARERIFGKEAERGGGKDGAKEDTGKGADRDKEKGKETKSGVARNPRGLQPANAAAQRAAPPPAPVQDPDAAAFPLRLLEVLAPLARSEVPSTVDLDKESARDTAPSWLTVNLRLPVNRTSTPPTAISTTLTLTPVPNEIERLSPLRLQDPTHPSRGNGHSDDTRFLQGMLPTCGSAAQVGPLRKFGRVGFNTDYADSRWTGISGRVGNVHTDVLSLFQVSPLIRTAPRRTSNPDHDAQLFLLSFTSTANAAWTRRGPHPISTYKSGN